MHSTYLNLGCADHHRQGFLNVDLDAPGADMHLQPDQALPWERGTVPGIYCAHLLERLSRN